MTGAQDSADTQHRAWMRAIAAGDRSAFSDLYRALEPGLFRFLRSRLNESFEAADILHDVFVELWQNASRFEGRSSVKSYVFGIAYRKMIDALRRRGRIDVVEDLPDQADDAPNPEACLASAEEAEHVHHCLGTLSSEHRSAIGLVFFADLSYRDIAHILSVPEGTVKTRIFHAKKLLLRCLVGLVDRGGMA